MLDSRMWTAGRVQGTLKGFDMKDDPVLYDKICSKIYDLMCLRCPRAFQCHEDCVECEDFGDAVQEECERVGILGYWD